MTVSRRRPAPATRTRRSAPRATPAVREEPTPAHESPLEQFLSFSRTLTGFSVPELWATGMVQTYSALVPSIVGDRMFGDLMSRWRDTYIRGQGDDALLHDLVKTQIFEDPKLGPLARNIAALWYLGMWNQLPAEWRNVHGAWANDVTFVVSTQAYIEALVWKAIHTHPPAAKQPGYGSWALPPETEASR